MNATDAVLPMCPCLSGAPEPIPRHTVNHLAAQKRRFLSETRPARQNWDSPTKTHTNQPH